MSFGVGIGDCIRVIELIDTIGETLRHAGRASSEFQTLTVQLATLRTALQSLENIDVDDTWIGERLALQHASSQCQRTIDDFWKRISKYQPHLQDGGSGSHFKDTWKKLKWTRCKEDLAECEAQIAGHTASIQLLLSAVEMAINQRRYQEQSQAYKTVNQFIQEKSFECLQKLNFITSRISSGLQQGQRLIETGTQILQMVSRIHSIVTTIPGPIERQQPVYFIDALGKYAPFHLEFIRSPEALTAVLKANLSKIGSGPEKVDRGEFALQDTNTKRQIMLSDDWETCFFPGQCVDMSMIFYQNSVRTITCSGCRTIQTGVEDNCPICGLTFQGIVGQKHSIGASAKASSRASDDIFKGLSESARLRPLQHKSANNSEDIKLFRNVRVVELELGEQDLISSSELAKEIAYALNNFHKGVPLANSEITLSTNMLYRVRMMLDQIVEAGRLQEPYYPVCYGNEWEQAVLSSLGFMLQDIKRLLGDFGHTGYSGTEDSYQGVWGKMTDHFAITSSKTLAGRLEQYATWLLSVLYFSAAEAPALDENHLRLEKIILDEKADREHRKMLGFHYESNITKNHALLADKAELEKKERYHSAAEPPAPDGNYLRLEKIILDEKADQKVVDKLSPSSVTTTIDDSKTSGLIPSNGPPTSAL
ncbi:hypothetical protein MMC17_003976 [Xylographa soralifera]|nr:hypothetical protein [Xylographa soralifera]